MSKRSPATQKEKKEYKKQRGDEDITLYLHSVSLSLRGAVARNPARLPAQPSLLGDGIKKLK